MVHSKVMFHLLQDGCRYSLDPAAGFWAGRTGMARDLSMKPSRSPVEEANYPESPVSPVLLN